MSSRNFDARIADGTIKKEAVRIIHRSPLVPPPPLAYSKLLSKGLRDRIKSATLEAHKFGKIGGYGGEMSHYIEVKDSDYDSLRAIGGCSEIMYFARPRRAISEDARCKAIFVA